jgi:hypothetical protein
MATRVSCGFAEITISFDMNTPHGASERSGTRKRARLTGVGHSNTLCSPQRAAQERLFDICGGFPHPMLT